MLGLVVALAVAVAGAAAVRSTWSPCGLSMLSTITPLGEQGRGNRYLSSAVWFVAGAVLGGATLGGLAAVLAAGVAELELSRQATLGAGAVAAAVAVASDLNLAGFRLPSHTRQVNEDWLSEYRSWVYAGGFGWQIGFGLATYVTTAAVYLMLALAALTASPWLAFLVVTGFGLLRGLAVFVGRGLTTPQRMLAMHRRLAELLPVAQRAVVAVQVVALAALSRSAWGPGPGLVLGIVGVASVVGRRPRPATVPRPALT